MNKICDECETVAHCTKHGCVPKQQALDKKAENAREIGLDYEPSQTDWEAVAADQAMTIALMKAEQPAQQEPVAFDDADIYGFWARNKKAEQPAQPQQAPQTSAQERTEFEQFWVDELGEADELTYGKLGYAIRRVDVAWEAWKAGKISANQQTIVGRKVWIDWKAQALELREIVRLNGIKIAELESAQSAQQEPVEWQHRKPIMDSQGNTRGYSDWLSGKGLEWWPHRALYTSPPAQRKPLTDEEIEKVWRSVQANDFHDCVKPFARAIEAAHGIKENT